MKLLFIFSFPIFFIMTCNDKKVIDRNERISEVNEISQNSSNIITQNKNYKKLIQDNPSYISNGFDFPIGKPNAHGYYNAQKFQENNHLGDDWNGVSGGNSDLGEPIYSSANGYIKEAKNYEGGWGNVVRIVHLHNDKLYESLYAHCDFILVSSNQFIKKGEQIATIGNCNGIYFAHLHLEIRDNINLDIGAGYSNDTHGYLNPTDFIKKNRN